MAKKLVIVESPAKAKTIGSYLGKEYEVLASVGHIRDLLPNGRGLPEELKKKWWADYAVDIDNDFEPIYEVPADKNAQVKRLRDAMKGVDTLVLATDEDREGESISWHLLQVLKPKKDVKVQRIAFHEITKDAILKALNNPRSVDQDLVAAQEARRVLDRLYGYTLSPVLWSRVMRNLSAGRVQTPAVKVIVDREKERAKFKSSGYWDLDAEMQADKVTFNATLKRVDSVRLAVGADFDDLTGELRNELREPRLLLQQDRAEALALAASASKPWTVTSIEAVEGTENPAPPFMTSTLQQDANRKFGYSADRTMRIAQTLYEGISLAGEQVGLITYMRTDSLTLSGEAISGLRELIRRDYSDCLPEKPRVYTSKVRNAQEAHEAIRPTDANRKPAAMAAFLNADQQKIYNLIWQRSVACQMKSAKVLKTEAELTVKAPEELVFQATGKQILFDGFRRLYMESRDEKEGEKESSDRALPKLTKGLVVNNLSVTAEGHVTKPPARYTEATLIKKLEENGIGRPSTYPAIISVILDRGYVRRAGKQLIPSFKAFLTMDVLEGSFGEFTELDFTRQMEDVLDEIADGKAESKTYLQKFFLGDEGLKTIVEKRKLEIPYPAMKIGIKPESEEEVVVRIGSGGNAFLQLGPREAKKFANLPEDIAPADLTLERALELLLSPTDASESVGIDPVTGRKLLVRNRQGFYLEAERTEEEIAAKEKPRWISVPPGVDPRTLSQAELSQLCELPREIGKNPETNELIVFKLGKFGAYVESGTERRTVEDWRKGFSLSVQEATDILKQPKFRTTRVAAGAIQEFGQLEGAAGNVKVLSGRFGPYVTDGEVNATLPKGTDPITISPEAAMELLQNKRAAGPSTRPVKGRRTVAKKTVAVGTAKKPAAGRASTKPRSTKSTKSAVKKKPPKG